MGEIYKTEKREEVVKTFASQQFRFQNNGQVKNAFLANKNFAFIQMSYYANNIVGYTQDELIDFDGLHLGESFSLSDAQKETLAKSDTIQKEFGLFNLIYGIDHLATRVFSNDREDAILELLSLTTIISGAHTI